MNIRVRKATRVVVGIAVVFGLMVSPAAAVPVTGIDLGAVALGSLVASFGPSLMADVDPLKPAHGTLTTSVYTSSGGYAYVAQLKPAVEGVSSFQTTFLYGAGFVEMLPGFTGRAGWSFSDALTAGASSGSGAFTLQDRGSDLLWSVAGFGSANWSSETPIRFFFESTYAPGLGEYYYEMMNAAVGFSQGLAPDPTAAVPEPGTLLLLATGLLAGGIWTRGARRQTT